MPLAIKTLPEKDRPDGFDGAVGQFKLGSFSIPSELETGNPVDLNSYWYEDIESDFEGYSATYHPDAVVNATLALYEKVMAAH